MRILKWGQLPPAHIYHGTCKNCGTEFECLGSDGEFYDASGLEPDCLNNAQAIRVKCPLCRERVIAHPFIGD